MHRIFSGDDWLAVLDIRLSFNIFGHPQIRTRSSPESASRAAASRPDYPVHPCSVYSPSPLIRPVAGKRELPKGDRPAFREVARRIPSTSPSGRHPPGSAGVPPAERWQSDIEHRTPPGARASRPHALPSVAAQFPCDVAADRPAGGNRMARPKQTPGAVAGRSGWRRWARLCQDLCGRDARAPGGGGLIP